MIDRATLRRRLLLVLFALGTNIGIRQVVATGEHGETEAALRHVRRHFVTRDNLRRAVTSSDLTALTRVPGVGKKGAERICLELRDKMGPAMSPATNAAQPAPPAALDVAREQVVEALTGLGWSTKVATDTVTRVVEGAGEDLPVAELLRASLRELGR